MKRSILSIVLVLALTLSLFAICVSAAETKTSLIPAEGATWEKTDHNDVSVNVEYTDDAVVFSGSVSGSWPSVKTTYAEPIVADVEDDYLSIDFTVAGGTTNMNFFFADGSQFSISNTALNAACPGAPIDTGSGDIYDGEYKCTISIADLVASTMNLGGTAFPAGAIVDGQISFAGINVYSVNGATVTINDLSVVNVSEDAPVTSEPEPENPGNTDTEIKNVAAGLSYTISEQFRAGADYGYDENAAPSYPDDGNELTDGKLPNVEDKFAAAEWMAFNQQTPAQTERGYAYVQFDLGKSESLKNVEIVSYKEAGSGIQTPYIVEIMVSDDGETYTSAGKIEPTSDEHKAMEDNAIHTLTCDLDVSARYVELRFTSYGWCFLGEIEINAEVEATSEPEQSEPEQSEPESSEPPKTGDAGVLVFAVLAVVAIAGCAVAVKARG